MNAESIQRINGTLINEMVKTFDNHNQRINELETKVDQMMAHMYVSPPRLWTREQTAEYFQVSCTTIDRWISAGKLVTKQSKKGERKLITLGSIRSYLMEKNPGFDPKLVTAHFVEFANTRFKQVG